MKNYLFFAVLAVSAASCRSYNGPTTASGQVVDRFSGQSV